MSGAETQAASNPAPAAAEGPQEIFVGGSTAPEQSQDNPAPEQEAEIKSAGSEEVVKEGDAPQRDSNGRFKGNGVQDRIDELTRARREAERDAEYWRIRAQADAPAQKPQGDSRPVRDNFGSDDDYQEALVDWKVDQRMKQSETRNAQMREAEQKAGDFDSRKNSFREATPDFDDVVNAIDAPVAGHVAEAIFEHPKGPQIMYELAKNPEMIEKLNSMKPMHVAFELGEIAGKASASAKS
ncbi:MAG: hypothetical protein ACRC8N_14950, partial [Aeromonas veronii]